jgi:hypothetical protein
MKRRNHRWQVHRFEDFFGDGLGLDERDEAELAVALRADDLEPERFSQQLCPRNVLRLAGRLVRFGGR